MGEERGVGLEETPALGDVAVVAGVEGLVAAGSISDSIGLSSTVLQRVLSLSAYSLSRVGSALYALLKL
jgi:hypothetical protein